MTEIQAVPPIPWSEYRDRVAVEYRELLDRAPSEADVQRYLEFHPVLLPYPQGFTGSGGTRGGHGSLHFAVVTQPPLPGIERPVPDFMRIARDSGGLYPILIEIEAPQKRVLNRTGDPSADFSHAVAQIADWRLWFSEPANQLQFRELYGIPSRWDHRPLQPRFVLIYGRRAEVEHRRALAVRNGQRQADFEIMSFDRLAPSEPGSMDIVVRMQGRTMSAVAFSPTFRVGPDVAEALAGIHDKEAALRRSLMMTEDRRSFLLERVAHWTEAAKNEGRITTMIFE